MRKLVSLARVSTLSQAEEGRYGIQRQITAARQYAADHKLEFDEQLSFKDLGKSGYKKKSIKTRALQIFLDNIQNGTIKNPHDYVLCVEDMSRFSRRPPLETMAEIKRIVESGMSMLFLSKNKIFTEKNLKELPNFIELVFDSNTAFSESAKKSEYTSFMWSRLRKQAADGKPVHSTCPSWLKIVNGEWVVIEERVEVIRKIFKLYQDGIGMTTIARLLNDEKIPTFGNADQWGISAVTKILANPAVYGAWVIRKQQTDESFKKTGESIENYFPVIIDRETFAHCRQIAKNRDKRPDKGAGRQGKAKNLFTHLVTCTECGSSVIIRGNSSNTELYMYQKCNSGYENRGCRSRSGVNAKLFENRILWFIHDELTIEDLIDKEHKNANELKAISDDIKKLQSTYQETCDQITNWGIAIGRTSNETVQNNFISMIENAEKEKIELLQTIDQLKAKLDSLSNIKENSESNIRNLKELIDKMRSENDQNKLFALRIKLKAMIAQVIESIYLHPITKSMAILFRNSKKVRYLFTNKSAKAAALWKFAAESDTIFKELDEKTKNELKLEHVLQAERGGATGDAYRKAIHRTLGDGTQAATGKLEDDLIIVKE